MLIENLMTSMSKRVSVTFSEMLEAFSLSTSALHLAATSYSITPTDCLKLLQKYFKLIHCQKMLKMTVLVFCAILGVQW